jgi:hypothetical protein
MIRILAVASTFAYFVSFAVILFPRPVDRRTLKLTTAKEAKVAKDPTDGLDDARANLARVDAIGRLCGTACGDGHSIAAAETNEPSHGPKTSKCLLGDGRPSAPSRLSWFSDETHAC